MKNPVIRFQSQTEWKYCVLSKVFHDDFIEKILLRLKELDWLEVEHSFYKQREFNLMEDDYFRSIFSSTFMSELKNNAERYFGTIFNDNISIVAHKMIEGDYIGIHTDMNSFGETHRLTLLLNDEWTVEDGGIFLTLNEHNLESISSAWLPMINTGVLFEICEQSFHAVTPINGEKERLSLIITFSEKLNVIEKVKKKYSWLPFPLEEDIENAKHTASVMGLNIAGEYKSLYFESVVEFEIYFGLNIKNTPFNYTYTNSNSMNVNEMGIQVKGSDTERISKISCLKNIPPIILIENNAEYTLVDGSHRLSFAKDNNMDISVIIFKM